jgi:hypothetical protein
MVSISYLVTVHNEGRTLANLLERLIQYINNEKDTDEIVILDDFSDNPETKTILSNYSYRDNVRVYQHHLDNNYGAHKNFGTDLCINKYVFQIDGDELPTVDLVVNIGTIIEANPDVELYFVPRINDFKGVKEEHAKQWGWHLSPCPACDNRPVVNWPDYQGRVYKNEPARIKWDRRLHEKIEGHLKFSQIPADTDLALYHDKTIETQIKTNMLYNEKFTEDENRGHGVFK